tara:strand:+ start:8643 stop:9410 length:768 start_codon:yes stop_codon:yes gene_type:complete
MNIVGDIAGQYRALLRLIDKMPKDHLIALGDLCDRGPESKEVIEFMMKNGESLKGNHEHILLDFYDEGDYYHREIWIINGGLETIKSFSKEKFKRNIEEIESRLVDYFRDKYLNVQIINQEEIDEDISNLRIYFKNSISKKTIKWLRNLPLYKELDDYILTHAPINPSIKFNRTLDVGENVYDSKCDNSLIWNRGRPSPKGHDKIQIFGHNAYKNAHWLTKKGLGRFALALDSSAGNKLSGYSTVMKEIYEENYD